MGVKIDYGPVTMEKVDCWDKLAHQVEEAMSILPEQEREKVADATSGFVAALLMVYGRSVA